MPYDPENHRRRSIRLPEYDYAIEGAYFVTICAQDRQCLFGEITDGIMELSRTGRIVELCWQNLAHHFHDVDLDAFVVMPNHIHGIVVIRERGEALAARPQHLQEDREANALPLQSRSYGTQPQSLAAIVQNLKSVSARRINRANRTPGRTVWQRNYYEHIIRSQKSLDAIRRYIEINPANWLLDPERANQ